MLNFSIMPLDEGFREYIKASAARIAKAAPSHKYLSLKRDKAHRFDIFHKCKSGFCYVDNIFL
ncbi:MAG: hypothetical protein IJ408_03885 [Clostridia bacterium]|nr:hypothetical protein [Clostridia bacterium]